MKAQIIKIGNSKGIRIPKSVIEECDLKKEVNLKVKGKKIVISSSEQARNGWESEFEKLTSGGRHNDEIIFEGVENDFDNEEWNW